MRSRDGHPENEESSSPSLWWDGLARPHAEPPLETDLATQYAIVGGGYTGLWTAYFLKKAKPDADIVLVEAQRIGHGASGRNGGWLMGAIEGASSFTDDRGGLSEATRYQLTQLVTRAGETLASEGIDCDFHHGGCVMAAARHTAQIGRARKLLEHFRGLGFGESDYQWLTPGELSDRIQVVSPGGGVFTPHVARLHPAKLVIGLAHVVKSMGVRVFEYTRAHDIQSGVVRCDRGTISAEKIVVATEGYSESGNPLHRRLIPVQTGMVATEPLSEAQWSTIGFHQRETFADCTRAATYLQRTADDRLVIGARGHYLPGGLPQHVLRDSTAIRQHRERIALSLFPQLQGVRFTHCWGGSVGVPRAWRPHVLYDTETGMGSAGGYVGEGVGASFLFGQTLAELITGQDTERTAMPWVKHRSIAVLKSWEPEPLPRAGLNATMMLFGAEEWLLDRYGNGWPARIAGWACDRLERH